MTLEIISAHEVTFSGEVTSVTLPGELGSFTLLKLYASIPTVFVKVRLKYVTETGEEAYVDIAGGLADVNHNKISVCIY